MSNGNQVQACVCGSGAWATHSTVWHAWRVNWNIARSKLPQQLRRLLKEQFICQGCRSSMKQFIIASELVVLPGTSPNK